MEQDLYSYLEAVIMKQNSPEDALTKLDELASQHVDVLRRLTKDIQDARLARDNAAIKKAIGEYDEVLEAYIPGMTWPQITIVAGDAVALGIPRRVVLLLLLNSVNIP